MIVAIQVMAIITQSQTKPIMPLEEKGRVTFIPQKLAIMVGIARIMVMEVSSFMVTERLLEMMDAKAFMVEVVMLL